MYRKDPRISHDVAVLRLKKAIADISAMSSKQTSEPTSELAYTPTIEKNQLYIVKTFAWIEISMSVFHSVGNQFNIPEVDMTVGVIVS